MNGFLQWPCEFCREAIKDGDGWLVVDENAARSNRRVAERLELEPGDTWTAPLLWIASHWDCSDPFDGMLGFRVELLRTEMDMLEAAYAVASRPHLSRYTNWATVLKRAISRLAPRDPISAEKRRVILLRDDFRCRACGFRNDTGKRLHIDHIYPVSLGGSDLSVNLQVLCDRCNLAKGMQTMERFMEKHGFREWSV